MSEMPLRKPTSENVAERPAEEVFDKIVLLLVSGLARSAIVEAIGKLGLFGDLATSAIAEAQMLIQIAAHWDRNEQLGTAMVRLNDIYRRALAVQDAKTALAVQRELNRLLDLYQSPREPPEKEVTDPDREEKALAEIQAAKAYLTPLRLGDEKTPLVELCRLAVLRILANKTTLDQFDAQTGRSISSTSRTCGRSPKRTGSARPRHRAHTAD